MIDTSGPNALDHLAQCSHLVEATAAAEVTVLVPTLAVGIVAILSTVVGIAMPAPEEFDAVGAVPTAVVPMVAYMAAASNCFVEVVAAVVVQQRHARHGLYDHCECAARCRGPPGSLTPQ